MRRIECQDIREARSKLGHLEKAGLGPVKIVLEVLTSDVETKKGDGPGWICEKTHPTAVFDANLKQIKEAVVPGLEDESHLPH